MTTPPKSWSGVIPIPCPWLLPPTQQEATNKTARRGSKAPTPTNIHNSISINRSWFYAEYSMTIMVIHDHTTKIMICLATIPAMSPCSPLPPNQPTAFSKLQIIWICDGKSHSTLTLHHPPSSTAKTINNQHSNIWPWFLLIMVANTTAAHSSHTTPTSAKHKMQRKAKKQSKQLSPCSHHAIFQWLFLYSASNGNRKGNAP